MFAECCAQIARPTRSCSLGRYTNGAFDTFGSIAQVVGYLNQTKNQAEIDYELAWLHREPTPRRAVQFVPSCNVRK